MGSDSKKKILIVDDDNLLRGIYAAKFREEGFEVIEAQNGREAWDIVIGQKVPDIIFTGIKMPEITGFELVERVRAIPGLAKMPFAISSHRGLVQDRQKAQELKVDDFIIQGESTPNEIVRRIKTVMGIKGAMKIDFYPEAEDGQVLIHVLNKFQNTTCGSIGAEKMTLVLKPTEKEGEFEIKLIC